MVKTRIDLERIRKKRKRTTPIKKEKQDS